MNSTVLAVNEVPALEHDEAMALAEVEYGRLVDAVERLSPDDWARPTDCAGWDVKDIVAHLLGMMERLADPAEGARQDAKAAERAQATGCHRIDALTAVQVEDRAHLDAGGLAAALAAAAPRAVAARGGTTPQMRVVPYDPGPPFEGVWTLGYLLDVILTRDPWMHRVDMARATGADLVLAPEHDGRIVADVVAEWARRHGQPFTLTLTGPAGGIFTAGRSGESFELDAVEFCRIVSGRAAGAGLLSTEVPF